MAPNLKELSEVLDHAVPEMEQLWILQTEL
jgi:hypothetical protein